MSAIKDRFRDRKWGIFAHYLYSLQNNPACANNNGAGETDWNSCVNALDAGLVARQLAEINAGYFIITVMQQSKYMIAPNETFNRITGYQNGEACSERDLIGDLYDALAVYDIPLFLYFTGDGPIRDEPSRRTMDAGTFPVTDRFLNCWSSVLLEYAEKYGDKIQGWWIDGLYNGLGYENTDKMKCFHDAVKRGNPDGLFSANFHGCFKSGGTKRIEGIGDVIFGDFYHEIAPPTPFCDFTAGDVVSFDAYNPTRFIEGAQAHVLSFLGIPHHPVMVYDGWGKPGCKYSPEYLRRYVQCVNALEGVVSIDVCLHRDGSIDAEQYKTLLNLRNLRG
ncbi:MAG: hypothetical protein PHZ09_08765 [Eubacteriales bacterium]|nr:hypothetical protein [Eubacteriales bacterium]